MTKHPPHPASPLGVKQRFFVPSAAPFLELRITLDSSLPYADHVHSAFSLGIILQGRTRFTLDGAAHMAEVGDIVLITQGSAHSCNPLGGPRGYHMLLMDVDWLRQRGGGDLSGCPPLIRDAALSPKVAAVMEAILADRADAADMLADVLQEIRTRHGGAGPQDTGPQDTGHDDAGHEKKNNGRRTAPWPSSQRAEVCEGGEIGGLGGRLGEKLAGGLNATACPGAAPSVSGLARAAGMRRESFCRAVRRSTGLPPSRYLHCLRLEKARCLLRQGKSIVEAALAAGYTDQSHFHRMFVRFYAVTPGCYRACHIRTRKNG